MISVEASVLTRAPAEIADIARRGPPIDLQIRPLLDAVVRDIRFNVHPPFDEATADRLSTLITALLSHVVEDLMEAPNSVSRPVTAPIEIDRLMGEGLNINDYLHQYMGLARFHFDREVENRRLGRRTDIVSKELDEISDKAMTLKKRITDFLQALQACFAEADI